LSQGRRRLQEDRRRGLRGGRHPRDDEGARLQGARRQRHQAHVRPRQEPRVRSRQAGGLREVLPHSQGLTDVHRERRRVIVYSLLVVVILLPAWQALVGGDRAGQGLHGRVAVARTALWILRDPLYDRGPNARRIALHL